MVLQRTWIIFANLIFNTSKCPVEISVFNLNNSTDISLNTFCSKIEVQETMTLQSFQKSRFWEFQEFVLEFSIPEIFNELLIGSFFNSKVSSIVFLSKLKKTCLPTRLNLPFNIELLDKRRLSGFWWHYRHH